MDNMLAGAVAVIMTLESRVSTIGERTSVLVSTGASRNWFPKLVPETGYRNWFPDMFPAIFPKHVLSGKQAGSPDKLYSVAQLYFPDLG